MNGRFRCMQDSNTTPPGAADEVFVGVDWGGSHHQLCAVSRTGQRLRQVRLGHDDERRIARGARVRGADERAPRDVRERARHDELVREIARLFPALAARIPERRDRETPELVALAVQRTLDERFPHPL